jgi:integrase
MLGSERALHCRPHPIRAFIFKDLQVCLNSPAEYTVPLSPAAVRLIGEAPSVPQDEKPGANDRAVFASKFEGVTTLARHSLSQAVRRIVADTEGLAEFTPHDLRRTGATIAQAARLPLYSLAAD